MILVIGFREDIDTLKWYDNDLSLSDHLPFELKYINLEDIELNNTQYLEIKNVLEGI